MSDIQAARQRLERSQMFQRSGASLLLLDFLLDAAAREPLKETSVGVLFFKRDATYDPRHDAIARTSVRRLRQRLETFYATEGSEEAFQIVIPLGSFSPLLQTRGVGTASEDPSSEASRDAPLVGVEVVTIAEADSTPTTDPAEDNIAPSEAAFAGRLKLHVVWLIASLLVLLAAGGLLYLRLHARSPR